MFNFASFDKMKNKFRKKNGSYVCVNLNHGLVERNKIYYISTDDWFVFWLWLYRYNIEFYSVVPNYKEQCIDIEISDESLYEISKEILSQNSRR